MRSPRPTIVYGTYWRFAGERQRIYFERLQGQPGPWTDDPILGTFRFTNAYRAADRVSQYLIREVIYSDAVTLAPEDLVFRILLFKIFNRIETWELLEKELGPIRFRGFDFARCDRILTRALSNRRTIYSAAYIMPSGLSFGHRRKHRNHLALLELMMGDSLPAKLGRARTMKDGFELLLSYPTIGPFLAYQFVTDLNYSELIDFPEAEFVMPGPGAVNGIRKAFSSTDGIGDGDIIRLAADRQVEEFDRHGVSFQSLFGRRLQLIDCQNLFCEVDKYSRVAHPEFHGGSGRRRIKQKYRGGDGIPRPWFPPKWGINGAVERELRTGGG